MTELEVDLMIFVDSDKIGKINVSFPGEIGSLDSYIKWSVAEIASNTLLSAF